MNNIINLKQQYKKIIFSILMVSFIICTACGKKNDTSAETDNEAQQESTESITEDSGTDFQETESVETEDTDNTDNEATESDNTANDSSKSDKLFDDFLHNGGNVVIADGFTHDNSYFELNFNKGDTYTLDSFINLLSSNEMVNGASYKVRYAKLDNKVRNAYAMEFSFDSNVERFSENIIISDNAGVLEINFAIDSWSRRTQTINDKGVIFEWGSGGAGSHGYSTWVPDGNFTYVKLSESIENYIGYEFYDPDDYEKKLVINDIMSDVANEEREDAMRVAFTQVTIDGNIYYYYLSDDITQDVVDYIDGIADNYNFVFDGKALADEKELEYAKKLNVDDIYNIDTEASWKDYE